MLCRRNGDLLARPLVEHLCNKRETVAEQIRAGAGNAGGRTEGQMALGADRVST